MGKIFKLKKFILFSFIIIFLSSIIGVLSINYNNNSVKMQPSFLESSESSYENPNSNADVPNQQISSIDEIVNNGIPSLNNTTYQQQNQQSNQTANNISNNNNNNINNNNLNNNNDITNYPSNSFVPTPVGDEMKAIWISYLDLAYLLKGQSQQAFTNNINKAFDNAKSIGLNTVIVHVRPFSDSIYESSLFPWSVYGSGTIGRSPGFDPLKIMVDVAHRKGLQIHAWLNPMRGLSDSDIQKVSSNYKIRQWYDDNNKRGDYIFKHTDGRWYYNPGVDDVIKLISDGASEIVRKYNVDGIHIDDYFYPSGITSSYDSDAYNRYKISGGNKTLSSWRISNNDKLVKSMYNSIKSGNRNVVFGVSPSGNNSYNINTMYCDPRNWLSQSGYLDYIAPQIYYGFNNSAKPFENTVNEWASYIKNSNVKYVIGLAAYKIGKEDPYAGTGKNEWIDSADDILKNQIITSRKSSKYNGIAFYDYKSIFTEIGTIQPKLKTAVENFKSLLK